MPDDMEEETYVFEVQQTAPERSGLSIHAGFPNPSQDARLLSLDFNQLLVQHAAGTFVFRVRGHDWQRFGIWDKDLAVVDRLLDARANDLVVWYQEGQAGFGIAKTKHVPEEAATWGVITALIHEFRSMQAGKT